MIDNSNAFLIEGKTTLAIVINADLICEVVKSSTRNTNKAVTLNISDTLSSMSEVILDTFKNLINKPLTPQIKEFLFAGIVDATNQFKSENVTSETFNTTASLIYKGMNTSKIIYDVMYHK